LTSDLTYEGLLVLMVLAVVLMLLVLVVVLVLVVLGVILQMCTHFSSGLEPSTLFVLKCIFVFPSFPPL